MTTKKQICPHCGEILTQWEPSPYTGWGNDMLYCDNNECEYFKEGRRRICYEHQKNFAYRYCMNPDTGFELPLIAWCPGDLSLLKGKYNENDQQELS